MAIIILASSALRLSKRCRLKRRVCWLRSFRTTTKHFKMVLLFDCIECDDDRDVFCLPLMFIDATTKHFHSSIIIFDATKCWWCRIVTTRKFRNKIIKWIHIYEFLGTKQRGKKKVQIRCHGKQNYWQDTIIWIWKWQRRWWWRRKTYSFARIQFICFCLRPSTTAVFIAVFFFCAFHFDFAISKRNRLLLVLNFLCCFFSIWHSLTSKRKDVGKLCRQS